MFSKIKNIEMAFQHIRLLTVIVIAGCLGLRGFVVWLSQRAMARVQDKIYVLAEGKALEAVAQDRRENLPVEARDHIRSFHQYFFTLDPDEKAIAANIGKALYLADGSARRVYDGLKEGGYYSGVIAGNISEHLAIDSIIVGAQSYPI